MNAELGQLQALLGTGHNLRLVYSPGEGPGNLEGQVVEKTIYIYSRENPIETLRHEVVDYVVSRGLSGYVDVINAQRKVINEILHAIEERAYKGKEEAVEAILRLIVR